MAKVKVNMGEVGSNIPLQFAGRPQEDYFQAESRRQSIEKMAEILRVEPAAYTVHRIVQLTAGTATWKAVGASDKPEDRACAEFVESCLADMSHTFEWAQRFALSCQAFGFADQEIVWKRRLGKAPPQGQPDSDFDDGLIGIRKLAPRRQETLASWNFDAAGGAQAFVQYRYSGTTTERVTIPITKILHYIGGDDRGDWEGLGWLQPAYKLYHMIQNLEVISGIGWQRAFVGLPVFTWMAPPFKDSDLQDVKEIGENLAVNEQAYVMLPSNVQFALQSVSNGASGAAQAQIDQLRWEVMSLACATFMRLGNTASGSRALANPLVDLFSLGIDAALDHLAFVLTRHLVPRLVGLNATEFPQISGLPAITHSKVGKPALEVINVLAAVQAFLQNATTEEAAWVRQIVGLPESKAGTQPKPDVQPEPQAQSGPAQPGAGAAGSGAAAAKPTTGEPQKPNAPAPPPAPAPPQAAVAASEGGASLDLADAWDLWAATQARRLREQGLAEPFARHIIAQVRQCAPQDADPATWKPSKVELKALARVAPADIRVAQETWRIQAPRRFRKTLDAPVVTFGSPAGLGHGVFRGVSDEDMIKLENQY